MDLWRVAFTGVISGVIPSGKIELAAFLYKSPPSLLSILFDAFVMLPKDSIEGSLALDSRLGHLQCLLRFCKARLRKVEQRGSKNPLLLGVFARLSLYFILLFAVGIR